MTRACRRKDGLRAAMSGFCLGGYLFFI